jgi:hypothetical protein
MDSLRNIHPDSVISIIGKGPSLQYLSPGYLQSTPVIALYESIIAVEAMQINNPIYSLQKDDVLATPTRATLLLHEHESKRCLPDYKPRIVFDNAMFGLAWNAFSQITAVKIAQYMGAKKIRFVCFDSFTTGSNATYVPGKGIIDHDHDNYPKQKVKIADFLLTFDHEFITPEP